MIPITLLCSVVVDRSSVAGFRLIRLRRIGGESRQFPREWRYSIVKRLFALPLLLSNVRVGGDKPASDRFVQNVRKPRQFLWNNVVIGEAGQPPVQKRFIP